MKIEPGNPAFLAPRFLLAALMALAPCPSLLFGQSAAASGTIALKADGIAPKPGAIGGFNVSNAMNVTKLKTQLAKSLPPTFTWPAGNVGDEYEISHQEIDFLKLQQKLLPADAFWFNQVNLFKGTLDQAIEQIRYSREIGVRTDAWTIGNEPDLYAPNRGSPKWTAEQYAATFREWAVAMKTRFPGIKVSGPAVSNPNDAWMRTFIRECGDLVDVLNWHWYPTDGKADDATALRTAEQTLGMVKKYQAWLKDPELNPKGYARSIPCALSEFSIHWDTQNEIQINDIVGACWTADVLGYLLESGIDYSHYFCLGEYGGHAVFNRMGKPRAMYWIFDFYREHAQALKLLISQGSAADGLVTVHGWIDGNGDWTLIAVNRSERDCAPVRLELSGMRGTSVIEARRLEGTDPAPRSLGDEDAVISANPSGTSITAALPGRSISVWKIGKN